MDMLAVLILVVVLGMAVWGLIRYFHKIINKYIKESDKHLELFLLMNAWVSNLHYEKKISKYLKMNNIDSVVIYGMSYVGRQLYDELKAGEINVKYAIDQNPQIKIEGLEIRGEKKDSESIDAVIVTSTYYFNEIIEKWKDQFECPILSIADIIYKM